MTAPERSQAVIDLDDRLVRLEEGLVALASLVEGPSCTGELGHVSAMGFAHVLRLHGEEAGRLATAFQSLSSGAVTVVTR